MGQEPDGICGYTWPEDHEKDDAPNLQSSCYRETLDDANRCAWHADPDETDEKTVEALQEALVDPEIRQRTSPFDELLDGAILTDFEIYDKILLSRVSLRDANFTNTYLDQADLEEANLIDAEFTLSNLVDANLENACLKRADLFSTEFTDANLKKADLTEANLEVAHLKNANLEEARLVDANLPSTFLMNANLKDANLTHADLPSTDLSNANLKKANLTDANFLKTDLIDAILVNTNLTDASLFGADLTNADLRYSDLISTNLQNTNLSGIDFRGGEMSNVKVNGATKCGKQTRAENDANSVRDWDDIARAYHTLKTTFNEAGLIGKARRHHYMERRSRGFEAKESANLSPWITPDWLASTALRYFIGYGVRVQTLVSWMVILFTISTTVYLSFDVEDTVIENIAYSVLAFTVAPPDVPNSLIPQLVMMIETFFGTLSIVLLGYVLGNREQF